MKRFAIALIVVLGSACGCSSKSPTPSTQPAPPPAEGSATPSNTEPPTTQAAAAPGIGETCGEGDSCAPPATCVKYYGIAGARGPEFKTCEVKCEDDSACPSGRKCATIADGPGRVCR
ncbi:MAG: hypothetical protein HOV81_27180 [Kofleriaceae bacterium]|nr:hypothetical protein [Kofleriaceae bacterium]